MSTIANLLIKIGVDADDVEAGFTGAADAIDRNIGKITAMGAIGGAALEGFSRSQQETNVAFERMARVTGDGSDAMRDMAGDLQDATFPMGEVVALMETATQRGLEGDAIAEYASFWDMVGDATGLAGPKLGEAGTALAAVGIAAGDEAEALEAFGFITDHTTSDVGEFLQFLERTGPELRDMGANVDDAAAIMGVLENEMGMSGRTARTEFRKAINDSDGTLEGMLDTLGVSSEKFDEYTGKVGESSGAIEANAAALAESMTPMQTLQAHAEGLMTRYGGLADAAGMLAVPMLALGPIAKGVSGGLRLITSGVPSLVSGIGTAVGAIWTKVAAMATWAATTVAQGARALASMAVTAGQFVAHYVRMAAAATVNAVKMAASWIIAMGPIGWVIAAVVALVALIIANWDKVVEWTRKAWEWVADKVEAVWDWITGITDDAVAAVVGFFANLRDKAVSLVTNLRDAVVSAVQWLVDRVVGAITWWVDRLVSLVTHLRDRAVSVVTNLRDRVVEFFTDLRDKAVEAATRLRQRVIDAVQELRDGAVRRFLSLVRWVRGLPGRMLRALGNVGKILFDAGKEIISGLWDGLKDMWEDVTGWFSGLGDTIKSIKGPLAEDRKLLTDEGSAIMEGLGKGLADGWSDNERLLAGMSAQMQGTFSGVRVPAVSGSAVRGGDGASAPQVKVFIGDRELTDIVGVEIDGKMQPLRAASRAS